MLRNDTVEMLAFNLKLIGKKINKQILLSAGKKSNKEKMLPAISELISFGVDLYATKGTSRFLNAHGIRNRELFKIAEGKEPNIRSFLTEKRFDLVINVLVGRHDYDESTDSNLIRSLCIKHGIPLITDVDVAIMTIRDMVSQHDRDIFKYKIADPATPWDMRRAFFQLVDGHRGFACYHAHFDKAYLVSMDNLKLTRVDMKKKWDLYRYLKENYTWEDLVERISRGVETMIEQGVTHCRSFIDADDIVGLLPIEAALAVRERYKDKIALQFAVQPLQGVVTRDSREYFTKACALADIIGGLPSRDRPQPEKHLDILFDIAKDLGKRLDVHVDQENNPGETETELLALKTIEHGMEGRVSAVHAISLSAKPPHEQDRIIDLMKDAGLSVIICPSAALSMKPLKHRVAPLHNSIAPLAKLVVAKIPVFLGVDNIHDLFMPLTDGDMWFECRMLMEACRYYDLEAIAAMACDKTGFA
uniref:Amidohydrolase family protein n=1 Tax=Candidatus Kentrum eta TaxID=2126337 RepID=A0A450UKX7_9GAMM|nr:MAG: Amidohydrolase family protein [Candidatus Kentron sp. H]VFJ93206.1 MAG: Amidohydrolase family protein [Candidatus Kentron sp. H]VFK00062.1 MAG: Amidohydrolase family protein [Candidatus Kentron sp. H]